MCQNDIVYAERTLTWFLPEPTCILKPPTRSCMKNFRTVVAMLAILACSLVGAAADDLPFGEAAWKNHVATNSYNTLVVVFQGENSFYPGQQGTRFTSFENFTSYVKHELDKAEIFITEANGFNPNKPLVVYIATVVWPSISTANYGFNDFIFVDDMVKANGHWAFPSNFINRTMFEFDPWQVLPLTKKAASAKVTLRKRSTGLITEQDTTEDHTGPLITVSKQGSVSVRQDLVWANPDYDLRITIRYEDESTETWDEGGKLVMSTMSPAKISLGLVNGELVFKLTGTIGQKVTIMRYGSGRWDVFKTVTLTKPAFFVRYSSGTNTSELFRLVDL